MNYTLNAIAESLAERAGRQFDIPFREQVKLWIGAWRARLIRDSLERNPQDRVFFLSSIVVPLEEVKEYTGCTRVLRTVCKIPQPIRANGILFDYIGSPSMLRSFKLAASHLIPALNTAKYTGANPKAAWVDNYVYIFNAPLLSQIRLHGVFEDLSDLDITCASSLNGDPPEGKCFSDDEPYPVSKDITQRIIQSILSTELRQYLPSGNTEVNLNQEQDEQTQRR